MNLYLSCDFVSCNCSFISHNFSNATLFLVINFVCNNHSFCFSQILSVSHIVTLLIYYFILYLTITFSTLRQNQASITLRAILLLVAILLVLIKASPPQNGSFLRSQQTSERGLDGSHAAQDSWALSMRLVQQKTRRKSAILLSFCSHCCY